MIKIYFKYFSIVILLFFAEKTFCHTDSLSNERLEFRLEKIEGFQKNTQGVLEQKFSGLEREIKNDYSLLKKFAWLGIPVTFFSLLALFISSVRFINKRFNEKFDKIITQKEGDILKLIDNQDKEKRILKEKKILVLTSKNGDDSFVRKFFKVMGFPIDNVNYEKVESYQKFGNHDLIFVNNEDSTFDIPLIQEYFEKSDKNSVVFYFGIKQYPRGGSESNKMNLANSRTQIYGNLINLLKYQEILE